MSYRTKQFYQLAAKGIIPNEDFLDADQYSNPSFIWPGNNRKHSKDGRWVDIKVATDTADKGIQRGFIRLLTNTNEAEADIQVPTSLKNRRCFFQFNPSTIVRNVSMNSAGMMNPLLQDPSQFSAPVPGNAGFAFELMFDRSFELAQGPSNANIDRTEDRLEWASNQDPLLNGDPTVVGVLADLRVLDAIVGQGLTEDMIDFLRYRGEIVSSWQTSDTYVDVSTPTTEEGSDSTDTTSSTTSYSSTDGGALAWDAARFDESANANVGNQAFLIPNPVRVLFSSLFMVDGYVTDMAVTFVKFNEAMVPMQCMVAIQMQAIYIGFAKKETFLTYALNQAAIRPIDSIDSPQDNTVDQEERNRTVDILNRGLRQFRAIPSDSIDDSTWYGGSDDSWENAGAAPISAPNWEQEASGGYLTDDLYDSNNVLFPAISGNSSVYWNYGFRQPVQQDDQEVDEIYKEFVSGRIASFSYSFSIKLSRKRGLGPNEATPGDVGGLIDPDDGNWVILGVFNSPEGLSASTAEEWVNIRKVNGLQQQEKSALNFNSSLGQSWGRAAGITVVDALGNRVASPTTAQVASVWNDHYYDYLYNKTGQFKTTIELTVTVNDIAGNTIVGKATGSGLHTFNRQIVVAKTAVFEKTAAVDPDSGGTPDGTSGGTSGGGTLPTYPRRYT